MSDNFLDIFIRCVEMVYEDSSLNDSEKLEQISNELYDLKMYRKDEMGKEIKETSVEKVTERELGHSGLFATPSSLDDANKLVEKFAKSISPNGICIYSAVHSYHNAFINYLLKNYNVTRKGDANEK